MSHTRPFTIGLAIAGLLGLLDLATWLFGVGGEGQPPVPAAAVITLLGAVTLAGAWFAWQGRRGGLIAVVVTRILSGLASAPAFLDETISATNLVLIGIGIAVTVVALVLLWPALRTRAVAAS